MPEPRVQDLLRGVLNWQTAFGPAVNVMHFKRESVAEPLTDVATQLIAAVRTFMYTTPTGGTAPVRNYIHTGCELVNAVVTDWSVIDGAQGTAVPNPVIAGAGTQPEPGQISIVISWRTLFSGASKRGRSYLPGIATAAVTAGRLNSVAQGNIRAAAAAFISDMAVAGNPLVIYSRKEPGSFTEVATASVDDRMDVQRSRGQ